jgi:hypothetical protein
MLALQGIQGSAVRIAMFHGYARRALISSAVPLSGLPGPVLLFSRIIDIGQ